jgi:hypothetical protein
MGAFSHPAERRWGGTYAIALRQADYSCVSDGFIRTCDCCEMLHTPMPMVLFVLEILVFPKDSPVKQIHLDYHR